MRLVAVSLFLMLALVSVLPTATAGPKEDLEPALGLVGNTVRAPDPRNPLSHGDQVTTPIYQQLRPYCADLLADLREDGTLGNHSDHRPLGYEREWMWAAPECAELRNEIQWEANAYGAAGYQEYCNYNAGVNCVAVNHYACDFALLLDSGYIYYCLGGFNPEN